MVATEVSWHNLQQFWLPIALYALVTSASPGPVNIVAATSGMNFGIRRTLPQVSGATLGFSTLLSAMGLGLGALFSQIPSLQLGLKLLGGTFLCYLAWKLWHAADDTISQCIDAPPSFWDGFLSQWVNPKAWIVSAAGVTTYGVPGDAYAISVLTMSGVFMIVCFPSVGAWAVMGSFARSWLKTPNAIRRFNAAMALLLLVSVVSLLLPH